jgi:hypothetical protein
MDSKLIFSNEDHKYGSIVELDFTEDIDFTDQDLSDSEKVVIEESVLYQSELREYIKPHSGSKLDSFAKNLLNGDLFANVYDSLNLEGQKRITSYWPWQNFGFENIKQFTDKYFNTGVSFIKDNPGFRMGVHTDNRVVVANAIINLTDNSNSTKFYYSVQEPHNVIYEGPKEKGKGVFFLNNEETAHSIFITEPRCVAMWNMSLTIIK